MNERKKFALRISSYVCVALIIPLVFLIWRFDLFKPVTNARKISGWGFVTILFIFIFVWCLFNSIRKGMKFSLSKQTLDGICKITLPLIVVDLVLMWLSSCIVEAGQFLVVVTICETAAIPINPIPAWRHNNNVEESTGILKSVWTALTKSEKK